MKHKIREREKLKSGPVNEKRVYGQISKANLSFFFNNIFNNPLLEIDIQHTDFNCLQP